ncbi:MAG: T9SS type A sorting domain-containing protein [Bacteroidota bacterium]|jgi:hypothetical protein
MRYTFILVLLVISLTTFAQKYINYLPQPNNHINWAYLEKETLYISGNFDKVDTSYRYQFAAINVKTGKLLPLNFGKSIGYNFNPKLIYNGSVYGILYSGNTKIAKYSLSTWLRDTVNWTNNSSPTVPLFNSSSIKMYAYGKYILMFANRSDWSGVIQSKGFYALDTLTGEFVTNKFHMIYNEPTYYWGDQMDKFVLLDNDHLYYNTLLWDLIGDSTITAYTNGLNQNGGVKKVLKDDSFLYVIGKFDVIGNGVHKNIAQINPAANYSSTSWKPKNNVGSSYYDFTITSNTIFVTLSNVAGVESYDKITGEFTDFWQANNQSFLCSYGDTVIIAGGYIDNNKQYYLGAIKRGMSGYTGLNEITDPFNAVVYPNPAATALKINSVQAATVNVYDVLGTLIYTSNNPANTHQIDVQHWKNGMYFVHIQTTQGTVVKKVEVIKE